MYIMIATTNKLAIKMLSNLKSKQKLYSGKEDGFKASELFIRQITQSCFFMESNKATLALLYDLQKRYPHEVDIYILKPYYELDIPDDIKKEVLKCRTQKTNLKSETLKKLEKTKIRCTIDLREVPSKSSEEEIEQQKKK